MTMLSQLAEPARLHVLAAVQVLSGAVALGSAYAFQYLGGLAPCALCLYQRWPWWAAIGIGLIAVIWRSHATAQKALCLLAALAIMGGGGVGVFHVGVEQHWWQGLASCGGVSDMPMTVEALKKQIMNAPVARCDEVAWSFLGISMAGYNALLSFAVGIASLVMLCRGIGDKA